MQAVISSKKLIFSYRQVIAYRSLLAQAQAGSCSIQQCQSLSLQKYFIRYPHPFHRRVHFQDLYNYWRLLLACMPVTTQGQTQDVAHLQSEHFGAWLFSVNIDNRRRMLQAVFAFRHCSGSFSANIDDPANLRHLHTGMLQAEPSMQTKSYFPLLPIPIKKYKVIFTNNLKESKGIR